MIQRVNIVPAEHIDHGVCGGAARLAAATAVGACTEASNRKRLHSTIGVRTSIEYEEELHAIEYAGEEGSLTRAAWAGSCVHCLRATPAL